MAVRQLKTDPARSVSTAAARCMSSSLATRSPTAARQSSTEVSGLAGLNTSDMCRSKPVVEKAANTQSTGQSDISDRQHSSFSGVIRIARKRWQHWRKAKKTKKQITFYEDSTSRFVIKSNAHSDMLVITHTIQTNIFFRLHTKSLKTIHNSWVHYITTVLWVAWMSVSHWEHLPWKAEDCQGGEQVGLERR